MSGSAEDGGEAVATEAMQAVQATMPVAASAAPVGMSGPQSSQAALPGVLRNSAFMPVPPAAGANFMPELQLFSQFPQLFSMHPGALAALAAQPEATGSGRTRTGDSKSTSAYASRHQAAEQRRRTRINERLDRLREVVPHAERANTAAFLETVIDYVNQLKAKVAALEAQIAGVPSLPVGQIISEQALGQQAPASQALPVAYTTGPVSMQQPIQVTSEAVLAHLQLQAQAQVQAMHAQQAQAQAQLQKQVAGVMPLGQASHEGGNPSNTSPATPEASLGHEGGILEGQLGSGGSTEAGADGVPFKKRPRIGV